MSGAPKSRMITGRVSAATWNTDGKRSNAALIAGWIGVRIGARVVAGIVARKARADLAAKGCDTKRCDAKARAPAARVAKGAREWVLAWVLVTALVARCSASSCVSG